MRADEFVEDLMAHGRHHFTTQRAVAAIGGSADAVRAQLRRLRRRGRIATPSRSFHVVVPAEYRRLGCVPAEHFIDQLMDGLGETYYVALLSAAARYGAAHQRPQSLQVMVRKNRAPVECGQVRVVFIARSDVARMPVSTVNTLHGHVRFAPPEVTALELVGYPHHAGGLSNVATVLRELAEEIDATRLLDAAQLSPVGWSQRLGYLLEIVEETELADALSAFVDVKARSYVPLRRANGVGGATRRARWKLVVNADVERDA